MWSLSSGIIESTIMTFSWDKPKPFVERRHCYEVSERLNYKGEVVTPLEEDGARAVIAAIKKLGSRRLPSHSSFPT